MNLPINMGFFSSNKAVGLDISDHSVEVVELVKTASGPQVISKNRIFLENGIVEAGYIQNEKALAESIKHAFKTAEPTPIEPRNVVVGIPEARVYTHTFLLSEKNEETTRAAVQRALERVVPLDSSDIAFNFSTTHIDNESNIVLAVAADTNVLHSWKKCLKQANIEIESLDVETLANFRALAPKEQEKPICVVDIGDRATHVGLFRQGILMHSFTSHVAGSTITTSMAPFFEDNKTQAEQAKIQFGLQQQNSGAQNAIHQVVQQIVQEVQKTILFFEHQKDMTIADVILIGGTAKLNGLQQLIQNATQKNVIIGDTITQATKPLEYITAVGLAIKQLDKKWDKKHPSLTVPQGKKTLFFGTQTPQQEQKKLSKETQHARVDSTGSWFTKHIQETALIAIIIFGIVLVTLVYFYKVSNKTQEQTQDVQNIIASLDTLLKEHESKNQTQQPQNQLQPGYARVLRGGTTTVQVVFGPSLEDRDFFFTTGTTYLVQDSHPSGLWSSLELKAGFFAWVPNRILELRPVQEELQ